MPSEITLGLAFTDEELTKAILLLQDDPEHFHERCREEIVKPALSRINQVFGQDNDLDWLAYFLEYALVETQRRMLSTTTENHDADQGRQSTSGGGANLGPVE